MQKDARPRIADFLARRGTVFAVRQGDCDYEGEWTLESVEPLVAPDHKDFADLECFYLVFKHLGSAALPQGSYRFADHETGFSRELFAVPCSASEMAVTIN